MAEIRALKSDDLVGFQALVKRLTKEPADVQAKVKPELQKWREHRKAAEAAAQAKTAQTAHENEDQRHPEDQGPPADWQPGDEPFPDEPGGGG